MDTKKILGSEDLDSLRNELRSDGRKVVLCHGVFDLIHPGHIDHLEEAKRQGDVLVVSVTSSPYVNKGPGRPYFNDELRMKSLAALSCVDYVVLSKAPTAQEILDIVKPDIFVKGQEYVDAHNDVTQAIEPEIAMVRSYGGEVHFTNGVVFSSTKLLNHNFPVFPEDVKPFALDFATKYDFNDVRNFVDAMRLLNVLVVGDIIIDEYVFCQVQGLMTKDRAFSARFDREECYLGGALAVARHIANFSRNVTFCGIIGGDREIHSRMLNDLSGAMLLDLHIDPKFRTAVKRRFVERHGIRNEYAKLFSINHLLETSQMTNIDREPFYRKLNQVVGEYDLVVVADYGHGLLDKEAMEILQEKARFLALNCQTNSSNFGTNLITKYRRADSFTLDESEIRLAFASSSEPLNPLLLRLMEHLGTTVGWLTLGSRGALGVDRGMSPNHTPAMTLTIQDTVGAGDAFFSLGSLGARVDAPVEVGSLIANIAGALAANILGNSRSVGKAELLKFASTILKF